MPFSIASMQPLRASGRPIVPDPSKLPKCTPENAAKAVRRLLAFHPVSEHVDSNVFLPAVAATLTCYPAEVVTVLVDPMCGLPATWPHRDFPGLSEIRTACEALMMPLHRQWEREARLDETRRLLASPDGATPQERERGFAYWQEAVRPSLAGPPLQGPPPETPEQALARLAAAPWVSVVVGEELRAKLDVLAGRPKNATAERYRGIEPAARRRSTRVKKRRA
jgi:hypothetical protein